MDLGDPRSLVGWSWGPIWSTVIVLGPDNTVEARFESDSGLAGVDDDAVVGTQILDRIHPDDLLAALAELGRLRASDERVAEMRLRLRHPTDPDQWLDPEVVAFTPDDTGRVIVMTRASERRSRDLADPAGTDFALAEVAQDGLAVVTGAGHLIYANSAFSDLVGKGAGDDFGGHPIEGALKAARTEDLAAEMIEIGERRLKVTAKPVAVGADHIGVVVTDMTPEMQALDELAESAGALRAVLEAAPAGVATLDDHGQIVFVNASYCDLTGFTQPELTDVAESAIVHPDDIESLELEVSDVRYRRGDGSFRWVERRMTPIAAGPLGRTIVQVADITDRKASELEAAERDRQLQHDLNHDPLTGLANARGLDSYLEAAGEAVGWIALVRVTTFGALGQAKGTTTAENLISRLGHRIADDTSVAFVARYGNDAIVVCGRRRMSEGRLEVVVKQLQRLASRPVDVGAPEPVMPTVIVGGCRPIPEVPPRAWIEIADRAAIEAQLAGHETEIARLASVHVPDDDDPVSAAQMPSAPPASSLLKLMTLLPDAVLMLAAPSDDPDEVVVIEANQAADRALGRDVMGQIGSRLCVLAPEMAEPIEGRRSVAADVIEAINTAAGTARERVPLGDDTWFDTSALPLGGRLAALVLQNVTAKVRAEASLAESLNDLTVANTELERFTASIAHDLKNPLASIKGFAMMLPRAIEAGQHELVEQSADRIARAAGRADRMISEMLEFARSGGQHDRQRMPLRNAVDEAAKQVADKLTAADGVIDIGDLPYVFGSPSGLTQVFANLFSNSIRYRRADQPAKITVRSEAAGDMSRIIVTDDGTGIVPDALEEIFAYGAGQAVDADGESGTGLGLASCRAIVARHGGSIRAEPADVGARFVIELPATEPLPDTRSSEGPLQVLLVDDLIDQVAATKAFLEVNEIEVVTALSVPEAIATYKAMDPPPTHVVTDLNMFPDTGLDLARAVIDENPGQIIVLYSGHIDGATTAAAARIGVTRCIDKISHEELLSVVRSL